MQQYEIRKGKNAPCELWSIVVKNLRKYENFVCEGTHTYCRQIADKLSKARGE